MSTWGLNGADNSLRSWASFDEMVWDEFAESGDHIVPDSEDLTQPAWTSNNGFCKKILESSHSSNKLLDRPSMKLSSNIYSGQGSKEEALQDLLARKASYPVLQTAVSLEGEAEVWNGYNTASFPSASDAQIPDTTNSSVCLSPKLNEEDGQGMHGSKGIKPESTDYEFEGVEGLCKDDTVYQDSDASIVNSSCHFSLSDICLPEGDLDFFVADHEDSKEGSLLEYGWGNNNNLDDVDKLFLNNDTLFPQTLTDSVDGIMWISSSPGTGSSPPSSSFQQSRTHLSPESKALKGDPKSCEVKMEFVPCDNPVLASMELERDAGSKEKSIDDNMNVMIDSNVEPLQDKFIVCEQESTQGRKSLDVIERSQQLFEGMEEDTEKSSQETDKTHKTRRHTSNRKRFEEKSRRQLNEIKLAPSSFNFTQASQPLVQYMPVRMQHAPSTLQVLSPSSSQVSQGKQNLLGESQSLQQCPQPTPYVHAGFGFPAHHMPVVTPNSSAIPQRVQQSQPVFISYQQTFVDASKHQQSGRRLLEMSSQPAVNSATMTPQEKIEKLRWRQKMQAKLAVEQQQKQLINEHILLEQTQIQKKQPNEQQVQVVPKSLQEAVAGASGLVHAQVSDPQVFSKSSFAKTEPTVEEEDESLEATVLHQLQNTMSKLDIRTRLCIRDALYRLARSAMQRHALGDSTASSINSADQINGISGPESSSSDDPTSSNRLLAVNLVETETNPIDRSIAHLLFHKCFLPSPGSVYVPPPSPSAGIPANSQAVLRSPTSWTWPHSGLPPSNWIGNSPAAETSVTPTINSGLAVINVQGEPEAFQALDPQVPSTSSSRLGCTAISQPTTTTTDIGLAVASSVQPNVISPGVLPEECLDGKRAVIDSQTNTSQSGYISNNAIHTRGNVLFRPCPSNVTTVPCNSLPDRKQTDQFTVENRSSNGLSLHALGQALRKESVVPAALDDHKIHPPESCKISDGSLKHIKEEKEFDMMELDIISPGCGVLSRGDVKLGILTEPRNLMKEE